MKLQLLKLLDLARASYWFVPTFMAMMAIGLSFAWVALDRRYQAEIIATLGWTYVRGPEGARAILSTIASSMMGVAGVTFSITIVALQLASSQFGPRLLRNFMGDTGNQIVLGTFISTFIYCLMVLRTIQELDTNEFVPNLAITFAVVLALASLGVLIYFIHHAAASIQAENIIAEVGQELEKDIQRLFPAKLGQENPYPRDRPITELPTEAGYPIAAPKSGYLQMVDNQALMKLAQEHQLLLRLKFHPGRFMVAGIPLVVVWPPGRMHPDLEKKISKAFILGRQRTEHQDVEFAINQLVEVALRALSPSINDPFTAIRCIDQLSAALSSLAQRQFPSPYRYDQHQKLRVIAYPLTFSDVVDAAFNQIRQQGCSQVVISIRLLEAIALIASQTDDQSHRQILQHHAEMIWRASQPLPEESDRQKLEVRYQTTLGCLAPRTAQALVAPHLPD